jgi:hypothetical protein
LTATPTISGLITATSGLTANSTVTVNSNLVQTTNVNNSFAGNVGIGTTNPTAKLQIVGGDTLLGTGTFTNPSANEDLYVTGNLEVDGNVYLGTSTANTLSVAGYVTSNLIPNPGSLYTLGDTNRRWSHVWTDEMTVTNLYVSSTNVAGTNSSAFTVNADNASSDTENSSFTWERGVPATNVSLMWNAVDKQIELNAPMEISQDPDLANSGTAALIVNQIQNQDIFTASASGVTKFMITNGGNVGIGTTNPGTYALNVTGTGYFGGALSLGTQATTTSQAVRADRNLTLTSDSNVTITNSGTAQDLTGDRSWTIGWTGQLPLARGGTGIGTTNPANGTLLIGNGTGYTVANITGTTDQVTVTNGAGTIGLSLPQNIALTSSPTFAGLGIGATNPSYVFNVSGNSYLTGTLGVGGTASFSGGATITGTTNINATGTSSTIMGNATGTLTLHGATTLDNTFTISGNYLTSLGEI